MPLSPLRIFLQLFHDLIKFLFGHVLRLGIDDVAVRLFPGLFDHLPDGQPCPNEGDERHNRDGGQRHQPSGAPPGSFFPPSGRAPARKIPTRPAAGRQSTPPPPQDPPAPAPPGSPPRSGRADPGTPASPLGKGAFSCAPGGSIAVPQPPLLAFPIPPALLFP